MQKQSLTYLVALFALCLTAAGGASAQPFDEAVFFGDSLTDSGAFTGNADAADGGLFTTNPGPVWSQVLASELGLSAVANNPNNPGNTDPNGTNYAQGGAQVTNPMGVGLTASPQAADPLSTQVSNYLNDVGGAANPNALYTLWGGANDVFFQLAAVGAGGSVDDAVDYLIASAVSMGGLVGQLSNAGANYVLVPNLPDTGATPSVILTAISTVGAGNPNLANALAAATVALAQPASTPAEQLAVQQAAIAAAEAELGVPAGTVDAAATQTAAGSSGLAGAYNQALVTVLGSANGNVIPLDVFTAFNEIKADPNTYGFANVTGTACLTATSLICTDDDLISPDAASTFLFADGVHPTTAGHALIADYAKSVLEAPGLVSHLAETPLAAERAHLNSIESQIRSAWTGGTIGKWSVFATATLSDNTIDDSVNARGFNDEGEQLTAGASLRMAEHFVGGIAIGKHNSDVSFSANRGGYSQDSQFFSVFAAFENERYFVDLTATLEGDLDFDDVRRNVQLGSATRVETGNTDGNLTAARLNAGANLWGGGNYAFGPIASLTQQTVRVDGYREAGNLSTSMTFPNQRRASLLLEAGLFAQYNTAGTTRIRGSVTRLKEYEDDDRNLQVNLNTMPGVPFDLPAVAAEDDAWAASASIVGRLSKGVAVAAGINVIEGDDHLSEQSVNLSVQVDL